MRSRCRDDTVRVMDQPGPAVATPANSTPEAVVVSHDPAPVPADQRRTGVIWVHGIGTQQPGDSLFGWTQPILDVFAEWRRQTDRRAADAAIERARSSRIRSARIRSTRPASSTRRTAGSSSTSRGWRTSSARSIRGPSGSSPRRSGRPTCGRHRSGRPRRTCSGTSGRSSPASRSGYGAAGDPPQGAAEGHEADARGGDPGARGRAAARSPLAGARPGVPAALEDHRPARPALAAPAGAPASSWCSPRPRDADALGLRRAARDPDRGHPETGRDRGGRHVHRRMVRGPRGDPRRPGPVGRDPDAAPRAGPLAARERLRRRRPARPLRRDDRQLRVPAAVRRRRVPGREARHVRRGDQARLAARARHEGLVAGQLGPGRRPRRPSASSAGSTSGRPTIRPRAAR